MRESLLEFFRPREERVAMGGAVYVVRTKPDDSDPVSGEDAIYQFVVRCTFDEQGSAAFTDEDIPALKAAPRVLTARLLQTVMRVNGLDADHEEKNSEAGPSSG